MSLPISNTDNIGNHYWGWRNNLFDFSSSQIFPSFADTIVPWINTSLGSGTIAASGSEQALILPSSLEVLTRPAVASSNTGVRKSRIGNAVWSGNTDSVWNTGGSISFNSPVANQSWRISDIVSSNRVHYFVINNNSISVFQCAFSGDNLVPANGYRFHYIGWLKNPLYTGSEAPRGFTYMVLSNTITFITGARPSSIVSPARTALRIPPSTGADTIANYSITCQTSTPGADTTDLWLFDDASPNRAIGAAHNLLKTSLPIPVGQIYRNTKPDPDGSDNQFWVCVGVYGSERILMRVWTQNLT